MTEVRGQLTHQPQHPGAAPAGGEAAKQTKEDDGGSGAHEDVGADGGAAGDEQQVRTQHEGPPHTHTQQQHTCHLRGGTETQHMTLE